MEQAADTALASLISLVADWLGLLRADPGLPGKYMGADFPLAQTVATYEALRTALKPTAARQFDNLTAGRPLNQDADSAVAVGT